MRTVGLILATVLMGTVSAAWWRNLNPPDSAYGVDSKETGQVDVAALEAAPGSPLAKLAEPVSPASPAPVVQPPLALLTPAVTPSLPVRPREIIVPATPQSGNRSVDGGALPPRLQQQQAAPAPAPVGADTSASDPSVFEPRIATGLVSDRAEITVWFELDQATLVPSARQRLMELVAELGGAQQTLQVVVDGHCDDSGGDEYNQILSEKRAQAVMTFLNANGVKGNKQIVRGFGERLPVAAARDEVSRRRNRRAEIRIDWVRRQTLDTAGMPDASR